MITSRADAGTVEESLWRLVMQESAGLATTTGMEDSCTKNAGVNSS